MSSSAIGLPIPEGPGSVSGAPNLPARFADTFTSRYIDAETAPEELLTALTAFLAPYRS